MTITFVLLAAHLLALVFGLAGMLIAVPNPALWASSPLGVQVFTLGMQYAGAVHIVLGALAMFTLGLRWLGWRRTLVFLGLSTVLSSGMELLGTGTGWPFGAYEYTEGLGFKLGGRVPYTIPLSWFTMGLASYLIGVELSRRFWQARAWPPVLVGVWLLTVWDLVLDPAMAHESLPIRFWIWHQTGPYFGMPIQNFVGWAGTGALFMTLSGLLWRHAPDSSVVGSRVVFVVYLANVLFAVVLSLSVSLWMPVLLALILGVLPAALVWMEPRPGASVRAIPEQPWPASEG